MYFISGESCFHLSACSLLQSLSLCPVSFAQCCRCWSSPVGPLLRYHVKFSVAGKRPFVSRKLHCSRPCRANAKHTVMYRTTVLHMYIEYCFLFYLFFSDLILLSYHIIAYHIIPYHIISYHIISYHIISYQIISYHIISYHIISYHIIPVAPGRAGGRSFYLLGPQPQHSERAFFAPARRETRQRPRPAKHPAASHTARHAMT